MNKESKYDFETLNERKQILKIPADALKHSDAMDLDLEMSSSENSMVLGRNSRCVAVATISSAPEGRREKRVFKGRGDLVKF
ncbi:hypothetical protein, partial [Yeosuana aromativorans]